MTRYTQHIHSVRLLRMCCENTNLNLFVSFKPLGLSMCVCVCVCVYLNWVRGLVCDSRPKFSPACQNWALSLHKTNLPMKPTETCTQASTQILTESWIANTDGLPAGYRTQTKFSSAQIHCGFFSSIRDQKGAMGSLMVWEHPLWPTWLLGTL